jgi:hypothetical protein
MECEKWEFYNATKHTHIGTADGSYKSVSNHFSLFSVHCYTDWLIVNQKPTGHYNKYDKIIVSKMVYKLSIMLINTFKYLNNLIILKKYYIIIKNIIYL